MEEEGKEFWSYSLAHIEQSVDPPANRTGLHWVFHLLDVYSRYVDGGRMGSVV